MSNYSYIIYSREIKAIKYHKNDLKDQTGILDYLRHLGPISGGKSDHKPDKLTASYVVLGAVLLYKPKV